MRSASSNPRSISRRAVFHGRFEVNVSLLAAKDELSTRYLRSIDRRQVPTFRQPITPALPWNVVGVGIGEKVSNGKPTGITCIKFLVRNKFLKHMIPTSHILPVMHRRIPTDIEEVGLIHAASTDTADFTTRIRPAQPGCSIGHSTSAGQVPEAGTFGALVQDANGTYILSNNHVLAEENVLPNGTPIFQPSLLDQGNAATDQIAGLTRSIALDANVMNTVDCAIAQLTSPELASPAILEIGVPAGFTTATSDMVVHKFGRSTGYTVGTIKSIAMDVNVVYDTVMFGFTNQIFVQSADGTDFCASGDSGSLILERQSRNAIGLLHATSAGAAFANHIEDVLQQLGVDLVTG